MDCNHPQVREKSQNGSSPFLKQTLESWRFAGFSYLVAEDLSSFDASAIESNFNLSISLQVAMSGVPAGILTLTARTVYAIDGNDRVILG